MHGRPLSLMVALMVAVSAVLSGAVSGQAVGARGPLRVRQEPADPGSDEGYAGLASKARADGVVGIIVELNLPFRPEGELPGAAAVADQRAAIGQAQRAVLGGLSRFNVSSIKQYQFIPYLAMQVDSAALELVANSPFVASIAEDVPVPPVLDLSIPIVNADDAWAAGLAGAGQAIAILDTGVDASHPFLDGKIVSEACYSTNGFRVESVCPNGQESQTGPGAGVNCSLSIYGCDHGTHVAGIAAGDGSSFDGVAREASFIAIQVFSAFSNPSCASYSLPSPCALAYTSDVIRGLERVYALRDDLAIAAANMSLAGGDYQSNCDSDDAGYKAPIDNLRSVGIAATAAAGNSGATDGIGRPACISSAVSVGATTSHSPADEVASYSNSASFLDLLAPGSDIQSSVPGGGYESWSGTSMAAPHVAGAWAILKSRQPAATVDEVLGALVSTGASILDSRNGITKPRIDVMAALNSLETAQPDLAASEPQPSSPPPFAVGQTVTWTVTVTNQGTAAARATQVGYYLGAACDDLSNRVDADSVIPLDPGASDDQGAFYTFQAADVGTRYLIAYADDEDEEPNESDEDNNASCYGPFDVAEAPPCPADIDGDGAIDVSDIQLVADRWREAAGAPYDVDGDGVVTVVDIMQVAARWGEACP